MFIKLQLNDRLTQERPDGADAIKRMKPEERLKLLKKTLKKSTKLTQKLLKKLDSEWDDVFKEDDSGIHTYLTQTYLSHG